MGAELFRVDRQTNMTKLIADFRNLANAPKKGVLIKWPMFLKTQVHCRVNERINYQKMLTCICLMAGGLLVKRDVRMSHDVTSDRHTT